MIFLTVGTAFPFDRLVCAIDDAITRKEIDIEVFAQVGIGGYRPRNFPSVETLNKKEFDEYFNKADAIIAHAGMGTITMALEKNKPILVMPRLKKYRELVNDHQRATANRFEQLGHIVAAYNKDDISVKIQLLESFKPVPRINQAKKVSERIASFLQQELL